MVMEDTTCSSYSNSDMESGFTENIFWAQNNPQLDHVVAY